MTSIPRDDLTVRLRRGFGGVVPPVSDEAANEIDRLRTKIAELEANARAEVVFHSSSLKLVRMRDEEIAAAQAKIAELEREKAELQDNNSYFRQMVEANLKVERLEAEKKTAEDGYAAARVGWARDIWTKSGLESELSAVREQMRVTDALAYAGRLATWLHAKYFKTPAFELLPDLIGRLTQIDHMIATLPALPDTAEKP